MNHRIAIAGHSSLIGQQLCSTLEGSTLEGSTLEAHQLDIIKIDTNQCVSSNYLKGTHADVLVNAEELTREKTKGHQSSRLMQVNCDLALTLIRLANTLGARRYIYMSSIEVLGNITEPGETFTDKSEVNPQNLYAASKAIAETKLTKTAKRLGIELVIIRAPTVYGPKPKGHFKQLDFLIKTLGFFPLPAPMVQRDFISLDNLVDFISLCLNHPKATLTKWVVTDQDPMPLHEFMQLWAANYDLELRFLPLPQPWIKLIFKIPGLKLLYQKLYHNLVIDDSATTQILGWTPKISTATSIKHIKQTKEPVSESPS